MRFRALPPCALRTPSAFSPLMDRATLRTPSNERSNSCNRLLYPLAAVYPKSRGVLMKRSILVLGMIAVMAGTAAAQARGGRPNIFAPDPVAAGPIADVVKTI